MLNDEPIENISLLIQYDELFMKSANHIIGLYLGNLQKFKNNINLSNTDYEVLLKVFVYGYDIVRNLIMRRNIVSKLSSYPNANPYPVNLLPEVESQILISFEKIYTKANELAYTFDAFSAIPLEKEAKKFDSLLFQNKIKEIQKNNLKNINTEEQEVDFLLNQLDILLFQIRIHREVYDFTGHATKNVDIETSQGTLFFEFTPSVVNRKIYNCNL